MCITLDLCAQFMVWCAILLRIISQIRMCQKESRSSITGYVVGPHEAALYRAGGERGSQRCFRKLVERRDLGCALDELGA